MKVNLMNKESRAQAARMLTGGAESEEPGKADIPYCRKTPGWIRMKTPSRFKPPLPCPHFLQLSFGSPHHMELLRGMGIKQQQRRDGS